MGTATSPGEWRQLGVALAAGAATWVAVNSLTGLTEAWDAPSLYWGGSLLATFLLGLWLAKLPPWKTAGAFAAGQFAVLVVTATKWTFIVLTPVIFALYAGVFVGAALAGTMVRERLGRNRDA